MQTYRTLSDPSGRSTVLFLVAALVFVVVIGAAGWYGAREIRRLEDRVATLDEQVQTAESRADRAEASAREAARRAEQAGEAADAASRRADQEAADRSTAEEARLTAQAQARVAQQRAAEAARLAELAEADAASARAEAERIRAEREQEIARLQEALGEIADTQRTALGLVMNLGEDAINFEYDKAELRPGDRELLSRIAGVLLTTTDYRIQIFGHTDDVGSVEYNEQLSRRRARAVADYLTEAGIDPAIMTVRGYGKSKPLVEDTSAEARARNRRVELGIIDTMVDFTAPVPEETER